MKKEGLSLADAARHIQEIEGIQEGARPESAAKTNPEVIREHIYLDADGHPVFKKTKLHVGTKTDWRLDHYDAGVWRPGRGRREHIPYHLDQFKAHDQVIICEGEKDADTVNGLSLGLFATSAPNGAASWPDSITPYFSTFKEAVFLYDIGNDEHVLNHAAKLKAALPELSIRIATVPGAQREFDISDYLAAEPAKADSILALLEAAKPFPMIETAIKSSDAAKPDALAIRLENEFLNEFVDSISAVTDAPRIFLLFSGIALLSGVANKFFFSWPRQVNLNLYVLLLAPSTFCRKSTCTDVVGDYLREVNPGLLLPESFTPEALFTILQAQSRGLIIWRELIQVKEFMFSSEYSKGLPAFLTDAYDFKREFRRCTKNEGEIKVENPIISILAAGIASWFVKNLNEIDFQGGIWTRFLFVPAPDQPHGYRLPERFRIDTGIKDRLGLLDKRPAGEMDLGEIRPLMTEWGARHMAQSLNLENAILQAVFLRLEVMLLKLASLFQLAEDQSTLVREPAFRDAERVIDFIKRRLPSFFQEEVQFTPFDRARAKVEKFLRDKGSSKKSMIMRYTHVSSALVERILKQLVDEGRAISKFANTPGQRGPKASFYELVN